MDGELCEVLKVANLGSLWPRVAKCKSIATGKGGKCVGPDLSGLGKKKKKKR